MKKWTLGLGGSDHDFAAALARDQDIRVAVEQERLSRRKHGISFWYESPLQRSIDYCLGAENVSLGDIESIVSADTIPARVRYGLRDHKLQEFSHHLCHAASAYMMLPPGAKAGVIVYDGFGSIRGTSEEAWRNSRETFSFFHFGPKTIDCIGQTFGRGYIEPDEFPITVTNSAGMLYELVTGLLGYDVMDAGKTMGLAAHGRPLYLSAVEQFVSYGDNPLACFTCALDDPSFAGTLDEIIAAGGGGFSVKADLAASVQTIVNRVLLNCERFFYGHDIEYLCISGGCALNTVANSFLVSHSKLNVPIVIPPHCGDAGLGLGAMWLQAFRNLGHAPQFTFCGGHISPALSRPGRLYGDEARRCAVQQFYPKLMHDPTISTAADLASIIAKGMVVGIVNGRSEIGPRALGGRSILADPRNAAMRERINRQMKHREPFRPLAPLILASRFETYFEDTRCADPFMLKIARVRDRCIREAPAIVHADGTARVQVVEDDGDSFLIELLRAFEGQTGLGILVNTSFNRRGEPIVESPADAIDAFLGMNLDGLFLDGEYYRSAAAMNPSV
jgi:carbamoyltransferase